MLNAPMRMRVALAIYLLIGVIDIVLGLRYFTSSEFMSYHSHAVGAAWQEVDLATQTLILALMKVAGAGWLVLGFFTLILTLAAFKTSSTVARWTIPVGTVIFYLASFAATWMVYQKTGATTPWDQSLAMVGFALLAMLVDAPWSSRVSSINRCNYF